MREEKRLRDRQASIVRLIADGRTNKEIACILNISLKTVETIEPPPCDKLHLSLPVACATPFAMV